MPLTSAPPLEEFQDAMEMMPPPPAYEAVSMVTSTPRGPWGPGRGFGSMRQRTVLSRPLRISCRHRPRVLLLRHRRDQLLLHQHLQDQLYRRGLPGCPHLIFFYLIHNSHIFLCLNIILFQLKVA